MDMYQKRKMRQEKKNENNNQESFSKVPISWYPGHMAKTKREISEILNLIDIIYEVVDARMPESSRIEDLDDLIKNKKKIIIMTKYDLCDKSNTDKFIEKYKAEGNYVVPVDLINGKSYNQIIEISKQLSDSENEKRKVKGLKEKIIKAAIIGAPNVGKSTLINRLVGKKKAGVGNKPGFTKQLSWIRINKNIDFLDTPGILWPKIKDQEQAHILAAFSSIKEEILDLFEISNFILRKLSVLYPEQLYERYGIKDLSVDLDEEYEIIAKKRGALTKGGGVDYDKVATLIINDLKKGYFGPVTFDRI